jgi:hypothetical protein
MTAPRTSQRPAHQHRTGHPPPARSRRPRHRQLPLQRPGALTNSAAAELTPAIGKAGPAKHPRTALVTPTPRRLQLFRVIALVFRATAPCQEEVGVSALAKCGSEAPSGEPVTPEQLTLCTSTNQRIWISNAHIADSARLTTAALVRVSARITSGSVRTSLSCWCRLGLAGQGRGRLPMARVRRSRRCSSGAGRLSIPCGSTGSRPSVRCQCARLGRSADAVRAVRWA